MNLALNFEGSDSYQSKSQKTRVVTESWLVNNVYCPICGNPVLVHYVANRPVADFYCEKCHSDFELKSGESKSKTISRIIPDGAYSTMIRRITSLNNPHLFIMTYSESFVDNLILIPKFFFVPSIIIQRQPLKKTARRAGWIGCNINIGMVPDSAKICLINRGLITDKEDVKSQYCKLLSLQTDSLTSRGWLIDTLMCIDKIPGEEFSLKDLYAFEEILKQKYPNNNFIKDKLRQQLQLLRDKGFIEFSRRGHYRKVK